MKNDNRLLAVAVFALAASLPVSAWIHAKNLPLPAAPPVPARFQLLTVDGRLHRLDVQTGNVEQSGPEGWVSLYGQ